METQTNHNRTTGSQDHRTTPQQATRSKTDALEGFLRRLETTRGKYTLLTTKRKYEGARHSKQAYNNRLNLQAKQGKPQENVAWFTVKLCKLSKSWHLYQNSGMVKNSDVCVIFRNFGLSRKNNRGAFYINEKFSQKY